MVSDTEKKKAKDKISEIADQISKEVLLSKPNMHIKVRTCEDDIEVCLYEGTTLKSYFKNGVKEFLEDGDDGSEKMMVQIYALAKGICYHLFDIQKGEYFGYPR